jgi:hypothetical protein
MNRERKRRIIHSLDEIPASFPSEDAEREYWETHELSQHLYDDSEARRLTAGHRALIQKLRTGTAGVRRHRPSRSRVAR